MPAGERHLFGSREIYLVQVTNGANDTTTDLEDGFPKSRIIVRKDVAKTSGTAITGVVAGTFSTGKEEIVMEVGSDDLCFIFDTDGSGCASNGKLPDNVRPTATPLAILKGDGTGFQFMALWYQPPLTGCDRGRTYLTLHEVLVGSGQPVRQLVGMKLTDEPVTSAVISGDKLVFIDSQGVHDITKDVGMQFVVGGALGAITRNGGQRFQMTGWTEMP